MAEKPFLTAAWRNLVMANYVVDPKLLLPYLPAKVELDEWNGNCYVSLVGFMFCDTKVLGIPVPFHKNFEEVNIRFYVRYKDGNEWKRGVTFISEIVPKSAITLVANSVYKENYKTCQMDHRWEERPGEKVVEYLWRTPKSTGDEGWNHIQVSTGARPEKIAIDSEAAFITEHYWGYTRMDAQTTSEYQVEHPRWDVFPVRSFNIHCDWAAVYGKQVLPMFENPPTSVLMAEGSDIMVRKGRKLP